MTKYFVLIILAILVLSACSGPGVMQSEQRPLEGINITLDPGHGNTQAYDSFRIGPGGEREEWINLRVAKILARKLSRAGANVLMTRTRDQDVSLGGRASLAIGHHSDLFVSIHHNGSENDPDMDLPIVYFFGPASMNPASVDFAKILLDSMRAKMIFEQQEAGAVYSDHLIYSSGTSVLRNTVNEMPGVIGEGGFFTHPAGESRLQLKEYNQLEADIYFKAILEYFKRGAPSAKPLVPDSLTFIDLGKPLEFELDDGFGNTFFEEYSFKVLQDGVEIPTRWNSKAGILTATPDSSIEKTVTFQVFARNLRGNAMHPVLLEYMTETGYKWYSREKWFDAYKEAESLYSQITSRNPIALESQIVLIDSALHFYQLSLELQFVHPQARHAEEKILWLLQEKQNLLNIDLSEAIESQKERLEEYYPE
ncbi:MAG: N-acetylmuramoyl-L-alanine amidase [Candidatus Marinimicrobia bacterium]|nr:N-acetylmuramoyl-L-alanine amidase [Candidatus Neomarinimicrobiota bacterium]